MSDVIKLIPDKNCCWRAWDHEDHEYYYFDTPDEMQNVMNGYFGNAWSHDVMRRIDREKEDAKFDLNHANLESLIYTARKYIRNPEPIDNEDLNQRVGLVVYAAWLLGRNYSMEAVLGVFRDKPMAVRMDEAEKARNRLKLVIDNDSAKS